jgi:hypothetical protein
MIVEITFKNGEVWELKPLYIADYCQYMVSEDAYYIVPCKDILVGRVSPEEFQHCQKEAKKGAPIGAPDLGKVLYSKTEEKVPCKFNWKEVKDSSS